MVPKRVASYQCTNSSGKRRGTAGRLEQVQGGFDGALAPLESVRIWQMAWLVGQNQSPRGSDMATMLWQSTPVQLPPSWMDGRAEPCRDSFRSTLGSVMGSDIVSATIKTLHKVLPPSKIHVTNMLQNQESKAI